MQDAVRLYKTDEEGRLLAMHIRKLENIRCKTILFSFEELP